MPEVLPAGQDGSVSRKAPRQAGPHPESEVSLRHFLEGTFSPLGLSTGCVIQNLGPPGSFEDPRS